jgi:hypothetical protein
MGQYFKPAILDENNKVQSWSYSHDYDSGLKLMEHSWMKNPFVQAFEKQLSRGGDFYKSRVVWAGDYADEEPGVKVIDEGKEYDANIYALCNDENKINPKVTSTEDYPYIVNHTKKVFVDKNKVPDSDGWRIHPLPLLTAEGNSRGGGDYHTQNEDEVALVGSWARDVISIEKETPILTTGTMDYKEIEFLLKEEW